MARARLLKPSFFTNDHLAALPMSARLLFQGLWCIADRDGRLEDRPARIKIEVMPYDEIDVDSLLSQLEKTGFVSRYEIDGERFIQIVKFVKHQSPHTREPQSTIPAPDKPGARQVLGPPEVASMTPVAVAVDIPVAVAVAEIAAAAATPFGVFTRCVRAYDGLMGTAASGPTIQRQIQAWLDSMDSGGYDLAEWFESGCDEAALHDGKSLKYVLAILGRWKREGREDRRSSNGTGNGREPGFPTPFISGLGIGVAPHAERSVGRLRPQTDPGVGEDREEREADQ